MDQLAPDNRIIPQADDAGAANPASAAQPLVWVLLGNRHGDNNQLFTLAEALRLPFEAKSLTYNMLRHLPFLRGRRLLILTRKARRLIKPPWPDLVIGVGYGSVPIGRYIRRQAGGATKLIHIGNPRTSIADVDLLITTPQYSRPPAANILALPFPIGNPARAVVATDDEERWLDALPHPRRLIAVGGPARNWKIDISELDRAIADLQQRCARHGGSVIAVTSHRSTDRIKRFLSTRLIGPSNLLVEDFPRFAVLLANCDEFYVTADSVSMISEAILTGKPVAMIPIARSLRGTVSSWLHKHRLTPPSYPDLPKFWRFLAQSNLVGRVDSPVASRVGDTVTMAVEAVQRIVRPSSGRAAH